MRYGAWELIISVVNGDFDSDLGDPNFIHLTIGS